MPSTPEPSRETIELERLGRGLLRLTLTRPDRGNALNAVMIRELSDAFAAAEADSSVRMIVLRGSGKHFCGGADIGGASTKPAAEGERQTPSLSDLLRQLDRLPKPTVAFVHGACIGAALALVSCCDLAIAAPDAFFSMPEVRLGMVPGLLPFFVRAVGPRAFRRYGLSGERFSAAIALSCGLVGELADGPDWDRVEAGLLDAFLHAAPETLGSIKHEAQRLRDRATNPDQAHGGSHESSEAAEGKASFKEKRKPNWYLAL